MHRPSPIILALLLLLTPAVAHAAELAKALEPLAPFIGKTWRGEFTGSTPEKPVVDVARWERALNGNAVRILHSINNGDYGGETLIFEDPKTKKVSYFYFTTAGFYTQGTFEFESGKMISREAVTGNADGITEVKGIAEILPDGKLRSSSEYLKNGTWVKGHEAIYTEAPEAQVIFK